MTIAVLDLTHEVSPVQDVPPHRRGWLATGIEADDWLVTVPEEADRELRFLADFVADNPAPNLQRRVADLALPHCRETMAKMKGILRDGVGFAALDRLPIDDYPIDVLVEVYWLLGQLVGQPVAQKWNGQMMYDVRDTGQEYSYGVRGSHTTVELVFHTDNAFARMVPDYVGLFCRNTAKSGGVSRFCNFYTAHERMMERHPRLLARLYEPMFFDRQKEHREDAPPISLAPFFAWRGDRLHARANSSLVRKGYDVAGETMDPTLDEALEAIDEVCASDDAWFEAALKRGQVQYLNNHEIGHYRSAFEDHDDPEKRRHLFRLWHRDEGSAGYDGLVR